MMEAGGKHIKANLIWYAHQRKHIIANLIHSAGSRRKTYYS
jgi:hypothetical protein